MPWAGGHGSASASMDGSFNAFLDHVANSCLICLSELQKAGILVSRIPDIFGGKSGHFQNVATDFSIFDIKRLKCCIFKANITSK